MSAPHLKPGGIDYPETDGQPMAEADRHRDLVVDLIAAARHHFRDAPDVYVSGNLLVYFVEGNPRESVAPDFFVVRGVPKWVAESSRCGRRARLRRWALS